MGKEGDNYSIYVAVNMNSRHDHCNGHDQNQLADVETPMYRRIRTIHPWVMHLKVRPHYNLDSIQIQSRSTETRFNPHQSRPHYTTVCGLSARVLGTRTN